MALKIEIYSMHTLWKALFVVILCFVAGCSGLNVDRMKPADVKTEKHQFSAKIVVQGDVDITMAGPRVIEQGVTFEQALRNAIIENQAFEIGEDSNVQYELRVVVSNLEHVKGTGFFISTVYNVVLQTNWQLLDFKTKRVLFQERINTTGTGQSFGGMDRLRLAVEDAVKENIGEGLEEISLHFEGIQ